MPQPFKLNAEVYLTSPNLSSFVTQVRSGLQNATKGISVFDSSNLNRAAQGFDKVQKSVKGIGKEAKAGGEEVTVMMRDLSSGAAKGSKAMDKTARSAKQAGGAIAEFGDKAALALKRYSAFVVATTAFYTTGRLIGGGLKEGIAFERQMIKIAQVTGKSMGQLRNLQEEIGRLSTSLGTSSAELVEVARILAQTGMSATDTKKALQAIALTDLAPTFKDMKSTVEGSIAIMSQFGISANELQTSLSQINAVASKFPVESEGIISAVKRMGGIFSLTSKGVAEGNKALAQMIGLFASVQAVTRESPERVSTGLRTIIGRLQRKENRDALAGFGINLSDEQGQFVGPFEAVQRIGKGLRGLGSRDFRRLAIIEQIGGLRQLGRLIPAIENTTLATNAYNTALAGQNSLVEDSIIAQQSMQIQFQKVGEEFTQLMREISQTESFKMMIGLMLEGARAAIGLANSLKEVIPLLAAIGLAKGIGTAVRGGVFSSFSRRIKSGGHTTGYGRASGGIIPGFGSGDRVPIMAEPGEVVINKKAVQSVGASSLLALNRTIPRFARGGQIAGYATGFPKPIPGLGIPAAYSDRGAKKIVEMEKATSKLVTTLDKVDKKFQHTFIQPSGGYPKREGRMEAIWQRERVLANIAESRRARIANLQANFSSIPDNFKSYTRKDIAKILKDEPVSGQTFGYGIRGRLSQTKDFFSGGRRGRLIRKRFLRTQLGSRGIGKGLSSAGATLGNPQTMLLASLVGSSLLPEGGFGDTVQGGLGGATLASFAGLGGRAIGGAAIIGGVKAAGDSYFRQQQARLAEKGIAVAQQGRIFNAQSTLDQYRLAATSFRGFFEDPQANMRTALASTELGAFGTFFANEKTIVNAAKRAKERMAGERAIAGKEKSAIAKAKIQEFIESGGGKIPRALLRDFIGGDIFAQREIGRRGSANLAMGFLEARARKSFDPLRQSLRKADIQEAQDFASQERISRFSALLTRVGDESRQFGFNRRAATAAFGGNFGVGQTYRANVFKNLNAYSVGQISGSLGKLPGLPDDIKGAVSLQRIIGNILPIMKAQRVTRGQETLGTFFSKEMMGGSLKGIPTHLKSEILTQLGSNKRDEIKVGDFLSSGKNLGEVIGKLSPTSQAAVKAMAQFQDQMNKLTEQSVQSYSRLGNMAAKVGLSQVGIRSAGIRAGLVRRSLLGEKIPVKESIAGQLAPIQMLAGTTDPRQIVANMQRLQTRLDEEQMKGTPESFKNVAMITRELNLNSDALKRLTQGVIGLTEIQNKLSEIQRQRIAGEDYLMNLATSSSSELNKQIRLITAFNIFRGAKNRQEGLSAARRKGFTQQEIAQGFQVTHGLERMQDPRGFEKSRRQFLRNFLPPNIVALMGQKNALIDQGAGEEEKGLMRDLKESQKRHIDALIANVDNLEFYAERFERAIQDDFSLQVQKFERAVGQLHIPEIVKHEHKVELNVAVALSDAFASLEPSLKQWTVGLIEQEFRRSRDQVTGEPRPTPPLSP
jgi:TP901 family phage tail tape measure protein